MAFSSLFFLNFYIQDSKYGFQPTSESLINRTPPLLTVAGVAFFKWDTSKISLISSVSGILSYETSVKTLLSSMTVFKDSIHSGSTSPSRIIHFYFWLAVYLPLFLFISLIITDSNPSFHSLVLGFIHPKSSSEVTALGSAVSKIVSSPKLVNAAANYFQTVVFPLPGLPIINIAWRTSKISAS